MAHFSDISSAEDLDRLSKPNQIEALRDAYENKTSWLAKGTIRGSGEFVRSGFSESHFPLELVQNADDEGATTILFEYDDQAGQLRVFDDGGGFDHLGVAAVCQQGQSRKKSDKQIGFMGIGFKSLFEVCNRVNVHSNDYHFGFDTAEDVSEGDENDIPGFLRPEWVGEDDVPVGPMIADNVFENEPTTTIVGDLSETHGIEEALGSDNLSPSVFLFLDNLEQILIRSASGDLERTLGGRRKTDFGGSVRQAKEKYVTEIESITEKTDEVGGDSRDILPDTPVEMRELRHNGKSDRYVLFRNVWGPEDVERPQFRDDIDKSDLFVAFRLDEEGQLTDSAGSIRVSPLFSYLPVKQYRETDLDFVVHADFDLTLNREDIQRGSPWNEQVIEELRRQVLVPVAKTIANHETWHEQLEYIVPEEQGTEGLIHDRLLGAFVEELNSMPLLHIGGDLDEDANPGLVAPEDAAIVADDVIDLLGPATTYDEIGNWPVLAKQEAVISRIEDDPEKKGLSEVLKNLSPELAAEREIDWFRRAFVRLAGFDPTTTEFPTIGEMDDEITVDDSKRDAFTNEIVPIEGGDLVAGAETKFRWGDVKLQPEGGYEGIEDEVQELTDKAVVDSALFEGRWGHVVRHLFDELTEVLTTAELLAEAATKGTLSETSARRIAKSYASETSVDETSSKLLRDLAITGAESDFLDEIEQNPDPEEIGSTIEQWAVNNWPYLTDHDKKSVLRYLKIRLDESDGKKLDIDGLDDITLPRKDDDKWVDAGRLLFPEEFNPDYDYERLIREYPEVFEDRRGSKYCFVDPGIINEDPDTWHTLLKKSLGVRDEQPNKELSGKIGEEFAREELEDRGRNIVADNSDQQQVGWDLKDDENNFYEVKSRVGRVQNIDLEGKQFKKFADAQEEYNDYEYYIIAVRHSLEPENTMIQDISDVADVLDAQDELSFDPRNTDEEEPI